MHTEHSDYSSSSALHSSYFGVKYLDFIIPIILVIFSSVAAILSLESRSLVYGAVSLAIFFLGLSLFFFYLGLTYLAIFQVAVYVSNCSSNYVHCYGCGRRAGKKEKHTPARHGIARRSYNYSQLPYGNKLLLFATESISTAIIYACISSQRYHG